MSAATVLLAEKDAEIAWLKQEQSKLFGAYDKLEQELRSQGQEEQDALKEAQAELARLKEQSREANALYESILEEKNALIGELALALEQHAHLVPCPKCADLVRRASPRVKL